MNHRHGHNLIFALLVTSNCGLWSLPRAMGKWWLVLVLVRMYSGRQRPNIAPDRHAFSSDGFFFWICDWIELEVQVHASSLHRWQPSKLFWFQPLDAIHWLLLDPVADCVRPRPLIEPLLLKGTTLWRNNSKFFGKASARIQQFCCLHEFQRQRLMLLIEDCCQDTRALTWVHLSDRVMSWFNHSGWTKRSA